LIPCSLSIGDGLLSLRRFLARQSSSPHSRLRVTERQQKD
jgi:hypothetical protein